MKAHRIIRSLLLATELNMDDMEDDTREAITEAEEFMKSEAEVDDGINGAIQLCDEQIDDEDPEEDLCARMWSGPRDMLVGLLEG